jgi:mRNA interferase MazF
MYSQYKIVIAKLDPTQGSEIKKTRPVVIVSPNEMNKNLDTIIICPLTTQSHADYPTRISFEFNERQNWIVVDQIRTIDKTRITKEIGVLTAEVIEELKATIQEMLVD